MLQCRPVIHSFIHIYLQFIYPTHAHITNIVDWSMDLLSWDTQILRKNETLRVAFVAERREEWAEIRGGWDWTGCWLAKQRHTQRLARSVVIPDQPAVLTHQPHTNGNWMALFLPLNKCNLNETQILQKFTRKIFRPCKFIANRMPGRAHKFILRKHHVRVALRRRYDMSCALALGPSSFCSHAPLNSPFTYNIVRKVLHKFEHLGMAQRGRQWHNSTRGTKSIVAL